MAHLVWNEWKETPCPFKSASFNSSNMIPTPPSLECTNNLKKKTTIKIMSELILGTQILSGFSAW